MIFLKIVLFKIYLKKIFSTFDQKPYQVPKTFFFSKLMMYISKHLNTIGKFLSSFIYVFPKKFFFSIPYLSRDFFPDSMGKNSTMISFSCPGGIMICFGRTWKTSSWSGILSETLSSMFPKFFRAMESLAACRTVDSSLTISRYLGMCSRATPTIACRSIVLRGGMLAVGVSTSMSILAVISSGGFWAKAVYVEKKNQCYSMVWFTCIYLVNIQI